ncbi:MAG TPA: glycosyltransferase [Desulfocapsa sulfexigens]|nr:glycosyltransferase [Desulfocapsa sulfexigens]
MTDSLDPWRFFDKIYCISIDTRNDRRTEAKKQFTRAGLLERVEFVHVKKHPENREKGIFQSHMKCLKKGLQEGANHILIFEDDILIKNFHPQSLLNAVHFLKNKQNWNAFFLGAISSNIKKTEESSVVSIQYRCLAHAYALNRPFARQFSRQSWNNIPYDNLLQKQCKEFFALSPMIAFQSTASSDNQTIVLDRMRRFLGGLLFIQKSNEFFQRHKLLIICSHVIFFLIITILIGTF